MGGDERRARAGCGWRACDCRNHRNNHPALAGCEIGAGGNGTAFPSSPFLQSDPLMRKGQIVAALGGDCRSSQRKSRTAKQTSPSQWEACWRAGKAREALPQNRRNDAALVRARNENARQPAQVPKHETLNPPAFVDGHNRILINAWRREQDSPVQVAPRHGDGAAEDGRGGGGSVCSGGVQ